MAKPLAYPEDICSQVKGLGGAGGAGESVGIVAGQEAVDDEEGTTDGNADRGILQQHEAGANGANLARQTRMPHQRNVIR